MVHIFLSNKYNQSLFKVTPLSKWGNFEQRNILWLEKPIQISPAKTATVWDMHNQRVVSAHHP